MTWLLCFQLLGDSTVEWLIHIAIIDDPPVAMGFRLSVLHDHSPPGDDNVSHQGDPSFVKRRQQDMLERMDTNIVSFLFALKTKTLMWFQYETWKTESTIVIEKCN